ncbi:class I SAM-dependent methyltransferase [Candidatus Pacearchaeota archaeon]|nr:class I SAM-dependent methyltransferase [Candidatus Pacearchaeota archaeon]PIY81283.1 MAG: hypothetical protein COY79_03305 [Candidatus Pacearchaeota archaeon CG_4_10_14_0_8_um_filter_35_169]PJB94441.1 MAG: hypothetical protein CO081_01090 [Candidatus Pacearchaeota archaeon CG_4_9_14_0_8_um_filter_35_24]
MAKKLTNCPCCDGMIGVLYEELYDKSYMVPGKFKMFRCNRCGLDFINPIMNEKELGKYYPEDEYYSFYDYNKLALVYHKVSALYHSKKNFFVSILLKPFSSLLYTYKLGKGKSILEIGCGNGMMLEIYRSYGLKTSGLEPYGPELTKRETNLGILRKNIKDVQYPENNFDYIVMKEVLEHVPDQESVLKKCLKWLNPGGRLIITVPNTDSLWRRIYGKNWFGYDVPRHIYNYSPKNISILLKKIGFKINNIRVYDTPYMIDGSMKFERVDRTGKKEHRVIFSNFSKIILVPISLLVNYFKKGSLMEIECVK